MSMLVGLGRENCLLEIGTGELIPTVSVDVKPSEPGVPALEWLQREAMTPPFNENYASRVSCLKDVF